MVIILLYANVKVFVEKNKNSQVAEAIGRVMIDWKTLS